MEEKSLSILITLVVEDTARVDRAIYSLTHIGLSKIYEEAESSKSILLKYWKRYRLRKRAGFWGSRIQHATRRLVLYQRLLQALEGKRSDGATTVQALTNELLNDTGMPGPVAVSIVLLLRAIARGH